MKKFNLEDKTILVTGASSGLGESLSKKVAELGAHVYAASRNTEALDKLASQSIKGAITPVQTDIRDLDSIKNLFEAIDKSRGSLDIVVNNGAVGHNSPIYETGDGEVRNVIETNLMGTIYVTREAVLRMLKQNNGQIVFVSSLAGKLAFPNLSVYSSTKFGIEGFAEAISEELKASGINIAMVRPGIMDTNFFAVAGMDDFARDMKGKMQSPDEVADQVIQAIINRSTDVTIGTDKRFMPFLKHLPKALARKILPYIT
jgi:short-subunit dehydrogenase